ncbi:uncharacterized protein LOC101854154 [Aplysia californica]|uniref:Netrin receptor UNC5 n=1 Tax=Aplysia californica TaxID=6500 RepID=A0ABM0JIJ7_APLCA|nr:uncharacterized protein LOC101854154 [Aplysia californica]
MANDTPPPMPEPGEGPQEFGRGFVLAVGVACASVAVLLTLLAVFIYSRFCTGRHRAQNGCLCSGSIPVLNCQLSHLAALPFQGQQVRRCGCSQLAHPPSYHSFGDNLDEGVEHVSRRSVSQHDLTSPEQPLNPAALSHRGSDGQFLPSATFYGASQNSTAVPMSGSCAAHSTYTPCTPRRDAHRQRRPCYPAERQDDASHTEAPSVPSSTATVFSLGHSQQSDTRSFFTQRTPIGDSTRHDSPRQPRIIQAQSHTPQVQSHTVQEYSRETQTQVQTQGIQNHAPQATVDNPHIQSHASQAPIVNPQTQTHAPQTQTHAPQIQSHAPQIQSHVAQTPFDAPQLERYATDPTQTQNYRSRLWNNSRSEEVSTAQPGNSVIRMSGDHVNERALQNPAAASSSTRGLVAVTERSVGNEDDGMAQRLERPVDDVSSATRSVDVLSPRVFSSHVVVLPRIDSVNQSNERDEMIELRPRPHLNLPENNGGTAQTTCFDARDAVATENSCVNQSRLPPSADSGYLPAVSSPGYEISPMPSVLNSAPTLNPNSLEGITDLPERRWEECEDSSEEAHHQTLRKRTSTDDVFQRLGTCTGDPNYLEQSNEKLKRDKQLGSLIRPESRAHASERECADDSPLHLSQEDLLLFRNPPEDVLRTLYTPTQCSRTSIVQGKLLVHIAKTIDSRGGELYLDKMGIRLRVPPLAILPGRRQLICLVLNWDLSDNPGMLRQEALVSPVIFCGPHGLTFDKPCTISFKHCAFDSRFAEIRCSDTDLFDSKEWSKMPAVVQSQGRGEKGQDDASERQQGDDQKNGDVETEETTSKVQRAQYFTSDECQVTSVA